MPRSKQASLRRKKRRPPPRKAVESTPVSGETATERSKTASEKKLSLSPYLLFGVNESDSDVMNVDEFAGDMETLCGRGARILEVQGLQAALLERCVCRECGKGPVEYREDGYRVGLVTYPYLFCVTCSGKTPIPFAKVGSTQQFAMNLKSILANKCVGGTHPSLDMLCTVMDLPPPITQRVYLEHSKHVMSKCLQQSYDSML